MRTRIVTMMAGLMALSFMPAAFGAEATFPALMSVAKAAAGKGELDNALTNFNAAFQAADKPELKTEVVFARNKFLLANKKNGVAQKLLKEFLADESLSPTVRRKTLNTMAGMIMQGRPDEAKQYREQAAMLPSTDANDRARPRATMGYVYMIKKQPENALEALLPVFEYQIDRTVHPSIHSSISHRIGCIYQQANDLENARQYFQLAVNYGKEVQYKFDYSASEKALKKLSKKK